MNYFNTFRKRYLSPEEATAPGIAGFCGGLVSTSLLLPLDMIKVRMQVNEDSLRKNQNQKQIGTTLRLFRNIIHHEGVIGLYRGWTPAVMASAVSWGGYFFLYEGFKKRVIQHRKQQEEIVTLNAFDNFFLACSAGSLMVVLTNPIWLIKLRMQLQLKTTTKSGSGGISTIKPPYKGVIDAVLTVIREEGALGLYKGTGPALLLTTHGGVQFVVYEYLKKHFKVTKYDRDKQKLEHKNRHNTSSKSSHSVFKRLELSTAFLAMGAVSKMIASTVTYPLQIVRARLQQRSGENLEIGADGKVHRVQRNYSSLTKTMQNIYLREGMRGFFKGCMPNALRVAPGAAVTFVVYETIMDLII